MQVFKIRTIEIPKQIQFFTITQNKVSYYSWKNFYSIDGDGVKFTLEFTKQIGRQKNIRHKTLYLDNHIIAIAESYIYKFNLDE